MIYCTNRTKAMLNLIFVIRNIATPTFVAELYVKKQGGSPHMAHISTLRIPVRDVAARVTGVKDGGNHRSEM